MLAHLDIRKMNGEGEEHEDDLFEYIIINFMVVKFAKFSSSPSYAGHNCVRMFTIGWLIII